MKLLQKCIQLWNTKAHDEQLSLKPSNFYYFYYPKTADDGRGFGCVISMLLLHKCESLMFLQKAALSVFPPDERHAAAANTAKTSNSFQPHVALVYAPEMYADWLERRTNILKSCYQELLRPIQNLYLSLWSTKGSVDQWERIARVPIHSFHPLKSIPKYSVSTSLLLVPRRRYQMIPTASTSTAVVVTANKASCFKSTATTTTTTPVPPTVTDDIAEESSAHHALLAEA
mmetsp:Transcript_13871/g.20755  ORF Transcript_13871/g.20755 Transcript_13871/m.20755 type:complete len:230 (-) Transcript_13871:681-1370(-)